MEIGANRNCKKKMHTNYCHLFIRKYTLPPPPFRDTKVEKRFYVTRDGYKVIRGLRDLRYIKNTIDVISFSSA